jgi:hypothetical protein
MLCVWGFAFGLLDYFGNDLRLDEIWDWRAAVCGKDGRELSEIGLH